MIELRLPRHDIALTIAQARIEDAPSGTGFWRWSFARGNEVRLDVVNYNKGNMV
jgi:hypothetical protein